MVGILGVTLAVFVTLVAVALLIVPALVGLGMLLRRLAVRLALLLCLVHRVQNTEVMFRMLKEGLRCYAIATAGRVSTELEILFEELLCGAAYSDIWPAAVEDVVSIKRDPTA